MRRRVFDAERVFLVALGLCLIGLAARSLTLLASGTIFPLGGAIIGCCGVVAIVAGLRMVYVEESNQA